MRNGLSPSLRGTGRLGLVGNDQLWAAGCGSVAAKEVQHIRQMVIVVVQRKVQAELGRTGLVDASEPGSIQGDAVPAG